MASILYAPESELVSKLFSIVTDKFTLVATVPLVICTYLPVCLAKVSLVEVGVDPNNVVPVSKYAPKLTTTF